MDKIVGILFLATIVEGFITWIFGTKDEMEPERPWLRYVSLAFGIVVAFAYGLDIPAMAGMESPYPIVANILSGAIIGRGSNYINDLMAKLRRE